MKQGKIKFNGQELVMKQSFRSLMEFETMTGKSATQVNTTINDSMKLYYCMLKAANQGIFTLTFDEFIDAIDDNMHIITEFNDFLLEEAKAKPEAPKEKKKVVKN